MKAIVIGGGIIGTATAFRLAQRGAEVVLLEQGQLASGTSSTSFAWMNSNNKAPLEYHRLNTSGMAEHVRLAEELERAPWLHLGGNVIWDTPAQASGANEPDVPIRGEPFAPKMQRLREWSYPHELMTPAELAEIHPDVRPHEGVEQVAYFPNEGYVDVPQLVGRLAHEAARHGAAIHTGQEVVEITTSGGRASGVRTASGDRFEADVVVTCTGRWTDQVTALAGVSVPMAPTLGLLVISSPVPTTLRCLAHSTLVNIRPDGGSRVMLASFGHDALLAWDTPAETLERYAQEILERATVILPALAGARVEAIRRGVRSIPRDTFPVVGPLPGIDGLYTVATHSGVTMGPLLGRLAALEILQGAPDARLEPFRPDRLLASPAAV